MEYVECPENWEPLPHQPSVFLAGGITGCPDWQRELASMLRLTNYAVLNPRRKIFPMGDPSAAEQQITWEFRHLRKADVIAFWFCKESIQPIALFELGAWSQSRKNLVLVGVEQGYPREQDIHIQMKLLGRGVLSSLEEIANSLKAMDDVFRMNEQ
jgi:hypothetical protein